MTEKENIQQVNHEEIEIKENSKGIKFNWIEISSFTIILVIIFLTSFFNYLLFHSLAEIFSIVIAGGIFLIGWNSRKYKDDSYFLILGISALFVAIFDIIHALSYEGLNIFPEHGGNLSTQLWIAGRYVQAFSFLFATLMRNKRIWQSILLFSYSVISLILLILIFLKLFPICFIDGVGLTPFKIVSEYIIIFILAATFLLTYTFKYEFPKTIYNFILLILVFFMLSEFFFTLYHTVYGPLNEIGHILKIIAFLLLYKVIVLVGFNNPVDILFKELKHSKEKMSASAARYFSLFENSPISVWEYDFSSIKKYVDFLQNKGIYDLLKYFNKNRKELLKCVSMIKVLDFNKATFDIYQANDKEDLFYGLTKTFTEEALNTFKNELYALSRGKKVIDFETTIKTLTNEEKNVIKRVSIVPGYEESWSKVMVNTIDITSRVLAEKKIEEFTSTVSHELRSPITVLKQSIYNLNKYKDNLNESLKSDLFEAIIRNIDLLSELIDDILFISRIDEKVLTLELEEISVYKIFLNLIELMKPKIIAKNISTQLKIDENLKLVADPKRFSQIFRIFIDNSIKYSQNNSSIEIFALNHYFGKFNQEESEGILFQIIDHGIGIKEQDLTHLFKRFYRSKDVAEIPGTGLGLSIAEELIKLHGGNIYVNSELGKSTTISVFFPKINF
ncbi:MAG: MASE3 domain-containing protein [Candidatus Thorarchaeota archaeon]